MNMKMGNWKAMNLWLKLIDMVKMKEEDVTAACNCDCQLLFCMILILLIS